MTGTPVPPSSSLTRDRSNPEPIRLLLMLPITRLIARPTEETLAYRPPATTPRTLGFRKGRQGCLSVQRKGLGVACAGKRRVEQREGNPLFPARCEIGLPGWAEDVGVM